MKKSKPNNLAVVVAMSGGVDSSVAAALLVRQGYRVIGATMKLWEFQDVGGNIRGDSACCSVESMNDARTVCQTLGMPHYVFDFQQQFNECVVSNFVSEYLRGRTPNPCVLCNTKIKWETLLKKTEELGADFIATGHYARIEYHSGRKRYILRKGLYREKDQSYALWGLTRESLQKTLFPLGELTKTEVRKIAGEFGLKTAAKGESQDICFVPDNDYRRLIRERTAGKNERLIRDGEIVTTTGTVVGRHHGYPNYTIGQRKGLGVAMGKPVYVVDIRPEENQIIIGGKEELSGSGLIADQVNWIAIETLPVPARYFVKIRYRDRGSFAQVFPREDGSVRVKFEIPQAAVTPGQSVVFYDDDIVVGGGIIQRKMRDESDGI
ncbi:MAG TPA: tRNA 2-thiouridine(34) synthase MnmA [Bacteroidetes bacterium]|nr:tRNA 2-thiouridine(34) synthase MnmA [Bacteroidota bacterium]